MSSFQHYHYILLLLLSPSKARSKFGNKPGLTLMFKFNGDTLPSSLHPHVAKPNKSLIRKLLQCPGELLAHASLRHSFMCCPSHPGPSSAATTTLLGVQFLFQSFQWIFRIKDWILSNSLFHQCTWSTKVDRHRWPDGLSIGGHLSCNSVKTPADERHCKKKWLTSPTIPKAGVSQGLQFTA